MKSKEEYLSDHCSIDGQYYDKETEIDCYSASVHDSMDEYAKEVSIDFMIWAGNRGYKSKGWTNHYDNDTPHWIRQVNQIIWSNPISNNQLFEEYIKSLI